LITSNQSNLTKGRIAAAHGRFNRKLFARLCQCSPLTKACFLGPPESTSQTASQSVQPVLQGSRSWQTDRQTDRRTADHATSSVMHN